MLGPGPARRRPAWLGGMVAICAIVALLVAMTSPSSADAAPTRCVGGFCVKPAG